MTAPNCCICGKECAPWYTDATGYGHNPAPFGDSDDDRCCTDCNNSHVIPARIAAMINRSNPNQ